MKKSIKLFSAIFATSLLVSTATFAASASSSMHYGKPAAVLKSGVGSKDGTSIVVTNCTYGVDTVSADFTDGSSNTMTIYPAFRYPMNIISIDNSYPYVNIEVDAADGTVLFPEQPVYPGQHVNIGCGQQANLGKQAIVSVSAH